MCSPGVENYGDLISRYFELTDGPLTLNELLEVPEFLPLATARLVSFEGWKLLNIN